MLDLGGRGTPGRSARNLQGGRYGQVRRGRREDRRSTPERWPRLFIQPPTNTLRIRWLFSLKSTVRLFGHAVPPAPSGASISSATLSNPPRDTRIAPSNAPALPPKHQRSQTRAQSSPAADSSPRPARDGTALTRDHRGGQPLEASARAWTIAARRCGSLRCDDVETKTQQQPSHIHLRPSEFGHNRIFRCNRVNVKFIRRGSPTGLTPRGRNDGEVARSRASTLPEVPQWNCAQGRTDARVVTTGSPSPACCHLTLRPYSQPHYLSSAHERGGGAEADDAGRRDDRGVDQR